MRFTGSAVLLLALMTSCASGPFGNSHGEQQPAKNSSKKNPPNNEATYRIPESSPSGSVIVRYWGIANESVHMEVEIEGDQAATHSWSLDSKDLSLAFRDGTRSPPITANPTELHVDPGASDEMDLYFPIPNGLTQKDLSLAFDLHWQVETSGQVYAKTTSFNHSDRSGEDVADWNAPYDFVGGAIFGSEYGWL